MTEDLKSAQIRKPISKGYHNITFLKGQNYRIENRPVVARGQGWGREVWQEGGGIHFKRAAGGALW